MKDDYLWDGSGEPDADVEQLEKLLGSYRYQPRPLDARFEQQLAVRRPFFWLKYAAAAVILMALVGAWWLVPGDLPPGDLHAIAEVPELTPLPGDGIVDFAQPKMRPEVPEGNDDVPLSTAKRNLTPVHIKKQAPPPEREDKPVAPVSAPAALTSDLAVASPVTNPFVDAETARHIERAQALLRSFRNTEESAEFDLSYERQSSERLLAKNVLLRRDAEAKGNLPVQDLLGSLEPFLIDIAHLPDAPTRDDVRAIQTRMEKKEILTALQVYSAPMLSRSF
jgi:hypothetical protein